MIKDFIYNFMNRKLEKKKHDCIKLKWQKAELENQLRQLKQMKESQ